MTFPSCSLMHSKLVEVLPKTVKKTGKRIRCQRPEVPAWAAVRTGENGAGQHSCSNPRIISTCNKSVLTCSSLDSAEGHLQSTAGKGSVEARAEDLSLSEILKPHATWSGICHACSSSRGTVRLCSKSADRTGTSS